MVRIELTDGKILELDDVSYIIPLGGGGLAIKGWKTGLNQTYDEFSNESIKAIRFERDENK